MPSNLLNKFILLFLWSKKMVLKIKRWNYSKELVVEKPKRLIRANFHGVSTTPRTTSARSTSASSAFTADERRISGLTKNQIAMNGKTMFFDAKHLIGRRFSDPVVRAVVKHGSFEVVRGTTRTSR